MSPVFCEDFSSVFVVGLVNSVEIDDDGEAKDFDNDSKLYLNF